MSIRYFNLLLIKNQKEKDVIIVEYGDFNRGLEEKVVHLVKTYQVAIVVMILIVAQGQPPKRVPAPAGAASLENVVLTVHSQMKQLAC